MIYALRCKPMACSIWSIAIRQFLREALPPQLADIFSALDPFGTSGKYHLQARILRPQHQRERYAVTPALGKRNARDTHIDRQPGRDVVERMYLVSKLTTMSPPQFLRLRSQRSNGAVSEAIRAAATPPPA